MAQESESGVMSVLLAYLNHSWRNATMHDASRSSLKRLYFIFAGFCFALLVFISGEGFFNMYAVLACPLFVTIYGLFVIRQSLRYKERIARDMQVVNKLHDILLVHGDKLKDIHSVFVDYMKPAQGRRARSRISSTTYFNIMVSLISTLLIMVSVFVVFDIQTWMTGMIALAALLLHLFFVLLAKAGLLPSDILEVHDKA